MCSGAFALSWPLSLIFNPFMDMTVLVLLFVHVYLRFRKQGNRIL